MKTALEAKGLTKKYGDIIAVNNIDLQINKGEIFGLLGPNGAGKSSLMRMMYGSSALQDGELYILGLNAKTNFREIKAKIGIVPQEEGLDSDFDAYENLLWFARYNLMSTEVAHQRADELIREFQLDQFRRFEIQALSGGNRRKLAIARSLVNSPELLFLDEPTVGLDPEARVWIWAYLKSLKEEKKSSIILTTHYMEEAERICDRIAIISNGRIISSGSPQELITENIGKEVIELEVNQNDLSYYAGRLKEKSFGFQIVGKNINVHLAQENKNQEVLSLVHSKQIFIRRPNLNDVYLKLTGKKLDGVI